MPISPFSISCREIKERFPKWVDEIVGDAERRVARVRQPDLADDSSICFCATPAAARDGLSSRAAVAVIAPAARGAIGGFPGAVLICRKPDQFLIDFVSELALRTPYRDPDAAGISPHARVHPTARISDGVSIGPGAVVARDVRIAERVAIGANAVIEAGAEIGADTVIHPLVYIGHSTLIGARCELYPHATIGKEGFGYCTDERGNHRKIPHLGRVVLEDDVHVGSNTSIDRATLEETRIGAGAKIDNQIHIAHNCKIGGGSFLAAQFGMAGSSEVGRYFVGGGRSSVTGHVKVGDHVRIAALAGISKNMDEPGDYGGVPLLPLQQHVKMKAAMLHLPEMRKQLARLMKRVFDDQPKNEPAD